MTSQPPHTPGAPLSPDEVRATLRGLAHQPATDEREFGAQLHRRLAAAGEPPAFGWFAWLRDGMAQGRPVLAGAVLGALVTATAFMLLAPERQARDSETMVERNASGRADPADTTAPRDERPVLRPSGSRTMRTLGDRHVTRDRLGNDIGAERPERSHTSRYDRR